VKLPIVDETLATIAWRLDRRVCVL